MLCVAFALTLQSSKVDLAKSVTYETRAVPATRAIAEIADLTGQKLSADAVLQREILVIHVDKVTLGELLPKIAHVTSSRWTERGGKYTLVPDDSVRTKEERARRDHRIELMKAAIAATLKDSVQGEDGAKAPALQMAEDRLYGAILKDLDPAALVDIEPGARVVFSTAPTSAQRQLAAIPSDVLQEYVRAENLRLEADERSMRESGELDKLQKIFAALGLQRRTQPMAGMPAKILVAVERIGWGSDLKFQISGLDEQGVFWGDIAREFFDHTDDPESDYVEPQAKSSHTADKIILSEDTKLLATLASEGSTLSRNEVRLPESLRTKLEHPDKWDPLAFVHSEALLSAAKLLGKQLVADLPDDQRDPSQIWSVAAVTAEGVLQDLNRRKSYVAIEEEKDWEVIRPADPTSSRIHRLDRIALAKVIQAKNQHGSTTLEDVARYALYNDEPYSGPGSLYGRLFRLFPPVSDTRAREWDTLKFYGSLLEGAAGDSLPKSIRWSSLEGVQRRCADLLSLGAASSWQLGEPTPTARAWQEFNIFQMVFAGLQSSYLQEPTESLPNGLGPDAVITILQSEGDVLKEVQPKSGMSHIIGPSEAASLLLQAEPVPDKPVEEVVPEGKFQVGKRKRLDFVFTLRPGVYTIRTLRLDTFSASDAITDFRHLPPKFAQDAAFRMGVLKSMNILR